MRPMHLHLPTAALVLATLAAPALAKTVKVKPGDGTPLADGIAQLVDGDKLVIAGGEYPERLLLSGLNDIRVIGKGRVTVLGTGALATVFVNGCNDVSLKNLRIGPTESDGVSIAGSNRVSVQRVVVPAASTTASAFRVQNSEDVTIAKCAAAADPQQNGTGTGVTASNVLRLSVDRCRFGPGLGRGATMNTSDQAPIADSSVSRCRFEGITIQGMLVGGANLSATKNHFDACEVGIRTTGSGTFSMRIERNRFRASLGQSVVLQNPFVTVHRNTFLACEGLAISGSQNGPDAVITDNVVKNIAIGGIIVSGQRSVVRGNRISGVIGGDTRALGAQGTDCVFENNVVKKNEGTGLRITMGGNTFRRNTITNNGGTDVVSTVAGSQNTFEDNRFGTESIP